MKTEHTQGWGLRVGGPRPYLAWGVFSAGVEPAERARQEKYHKPVRVVMLTLHEYRQLKKGRK